MSYAGNFRKILRSVLKDKISILLVILILVLAFGRVLVPHMFKPENVLNVLRITSIVGLVAIGESLVLLTGEFDVSVGSIMSLALVSGGLFLEFGSMPALIITCLTGLVCGLVNGIAVGRWRVSSLIMTLGTMSVFGGLASILTGGKALYLYGLGYVWWGRGHILGIPVPVILLIVTTLLCFVFLEFTRTGKHIYYTGANETASWYSGVRVDNVKILAFSLSGVLAAMAGPMFASQTQRITPIQGVGFELSAFTIAFLGGINLWGGRGNVLGVFIAAVTYGFLVNILSLSGIGTYMEQVLKGFLLIAIVVIYEYVMKK